MKVCILTHRTFNHFTRVLKQIESLTSNEDVEVVAIGTRMFGGETEQFEHESATITHYALPVRVPMVGPLKIVDTIIAMATLFAVARREEADIYHCINVYALVVGSILATLQSSRTTYDASEPNGLQVRIQFPGVVGRAIECCVRRVEENLAARAVAVFTVNSADGVPYERLKASNPNTVVLENVPTLSEFEIDEKDRMDLPEWEGRKVLLYVGSVSPRKGGDMMIESMSHIVDDHPGALLVIIGDGTDAYIGHLHKRIRELGLRDNVSLLGPIDYDQVPAYLSEATIGYQLYQPDPWTSRSKASSTVFRYMGSGLPLVVTDLPGIGSLVKELDCGRVAPVDNPERIAETASELLANEELAAELAANGRHHVEDRYNWGVESEKFVDRMPLPDGEATS